MFRILDFVIIFVMRLKYVREFHSLTGTKLNVIDFALLLVNIRNNLILITAIHVTYIYLW